MVMARPKKSNEEKKARPKPTNAETRDDLRRLIPALAANTADFPFLEPLRLELETIVDELLARQAALAAAKQEATQRQQELIEKGRQLGALLRAGVKRRYGKGSEKLTEFNIQPFRGRKTAKPKEPISPTPPEP